MTTTYQFQTPPIKDVHVPCLFTEKELSVYLRICRRQLYNWRMAGLIPYLKLGKAVRFRPTDVQAALEKFTINPIR